MTDELTHLRADNERLRAALEGILSEPRDANKTYAELFIEMRCEIRAALAAQPAPSGWRPIETAPKDGTEVLMVFVFEDGEVLHRVVWWDGSEMWPWREEYTGYREGEAKGWMPIPPAPKKEEA